MNTGTIKINDRDTYETGIATSPGNSDIADACERVGRLLDKMTIVRTKDEQEILLGRLQKVERPTIVSFINAHAANLAWRCPEFCATLAGSAIVLRDGIGMSVMLRLLGRDSGANMNGTDLIPLVTSAFRGKRVALCGTREPYLAQAQQKAAALGADVVITMDGFRESSAYVAAMQDIRPDLIVLGMGMPKQEYVSLMLAEQLTHPCVIVNGGAILDFWANRFRRAPQLWQRLRMEWLFRMLQEPRRLWRRYILGGFSFARHIVQLRAYTKSRQKA